MSSDQAPEAPAFGDLFDDPDAPLLPVDRRAAAPASAAEPAAPLVAQFADTPETAGPSAAAAEPATEHEVVDEVPHAEPGASLEVPAGAAALASWDGTVDPAISSAPASRVDTGRLYRSAGAEGPATLDAIPAIDPGYVPRAASVAVADVPSSDITPAGAVGGGRGLTYSGVAVVVVSVTVLVAFADALINDKLGILTGVALAVSSIYAALTVRRADIWAAVVVPPLAFLVAALTAGQLTLDSSGSLVLREAYMLFRTLAVNAPWILGTTIVCLVIVLVRRARS